ncbi:hypothetical protein CFOL_v3_25051 [Cephalotus follicularis]|uniref:GIR1-like zinc ribbon domain-containing protein n=1 Tax=Cephalotus follicularis TaxID=3775 RepID=A0A1Q3CMY1_CEPFO|nr:hypothetical protein CFOL_v3_25051 [Cephalotus follicularis]
MKIYHYAKNSSLDLNLKLSTPTVYYEDETSNRSDISTPLSQQSCMSSDLSSNKNLEDTNKVQVSSLILMGCSQCIIYVMVPEADPICPKCNSSILIDIFRDNPAKKSRKR